MNGWQHDFPVIEGGRLVGMLNRDALVKGIRAGGTVVTVRDAMDGEFPVAGPEEPAHLGMTRLRGAGRRTLAVLEDGRLVGILTTENLGDYLVLRAALEREARTTQPQRAEAGCAPPRIEQPIPGPTGP
jgi:CBS domain-containing protein